MEPYVLTPAGVLPVVVVGDDIGFVVRLGDRFVCVRAEGL